MSRSSTSTYSFSTSAKTSGGSSFLGPSPIGAGFSSKPLSSSSSSSSSSKKKKDESPIIKNVDMPDDMQERVLELAVEAIKNYDAEKDRASYIKKTLDEEFDSTWHVIVGKHFASFVTHESKCFIYLYIGAMAILTWKSG